MKKHIKIILAILTLALLFVSPSSAFAITDDEFAANEDYYKDLCFKVINQKNQETCQQFQSYTNRKIKAQQAEIKDLDLEIEAVQANINDYVSQIGEFEAQIVALEIEIAENEAKVEAMEINIAALEEQIMERQAEIEAKDEAIKARMAAQQSTMHTNTQVSFLFGAKDFSDFIRRSSLINSVTDFDQEQIQEITILRQQLEDEQSELDRQRLLVLETIDIIAIQKDNAEIAKRNIERIVVEYQKQEAELLAIQRTKEENAAASQATINSIQSSLDDLEERIRIEQEKALQEGRDPGNIGSGSGWRAPISGSFWISAGQWAYPGGGTHYGVDFAAPQGRAIINSGVGVVVRAHNNCASPSGWNLGNMCGGGGWGNHVFTVVAQPDGLYAVIYAHLSSVSVSVNTIVGDGDVLGYSGNSGNSTGPHLHYEVIYLGQYSVSEYLNNVWNGNYNFTPNGAYMNLSWTCANRGGAAPCRVNLHNLLGYRVGSYY